MKPIEDENPVKGCLIATIMSVIFWLLIGLAVFSCMPKLAVLDTQGQIIVNEEGRALVLFKDLGSDGRGFYGHWFYFPGLGWIKPETHLIKVVVIDRTTGEEVKPITESNE